MIKKCMFISLISLSLSAQGYTHSDAANIVKQTFGAPGMHLSLVSIQFMENLFYQVGTSTPYEQHCASKKAAIILGKELEQRELSLASADPETKQRIEHNLSILTIQKDHYERVARLLNKELTFLQKSIGLLKNGVTRCLAFVLSPFKKYTPPIQRLTNDLVRYTEIERHEIFIDHKKTLRLIVIQNKYPIPLIIRFWDYPRHRHRLLNGVKQFQGSALPQAETVLLAEAAQTAAEIAGNIAEGIGEIGVVIGDATATNTLREVGESFESAWESLTNIDVEGLMAEAAQASDITMTTIADEFASVADNLPTVTETDIARAEALGTIADTTPENVHIETQGVEEATTRQAAEQAGQDATTNASEQIEETSEQTTNTVAEEAPKKLSKAEQKAEQKAAEAEAKADQKAAEAKAKKAAKDAKDAAKDAKTAEEAAANAEKIAENAEKAAQAATQKIENLKNIAKEKHAIATKNPTSENRDAASKASDAFRAAQEAAQTAEETAEIAAQKAQGAADDAKPLRIKADNAKDAAKKAAIEAFGPQKTWAEQGKEFVEMAQALVLQMEVSMGAQMVAAWQSAADALTFASLSQQRTALMTNLNHFFSQLSVQQTNALAQINANFSAQIAVIASQLCLQTTSAGTVALSGLLPTLLAVEQSFVTQALINATVKSIFLLNPMPDDQLFYYSPMAAQQTISSHTPFVSNGLSNTWYNPYRAGNWQFCSVDYSGITQGPITSFVQYGAQSFTSQTYPNGDPTLAVQNSIFAEYIPPIQYNKQSVESYTISVACTLLSEPYEPFMMGVMFNGARWISGVLDLHHQHRLFCIYTIPGQKSGTYNVGFAETFYQNQGQMNSSQNQLSDQNVAGLNAIWPAYQILSPDITALAAVAKSNAATPVTNPIATIPALPVGTPYIFTIETQPNQVTLTISTPNGEILYPAGQTASSLKNELSLPNQFQKLNGLMFLYHNIGFTAPGCSSQFCIQKPTSLCFSESQIKTIQASLNKGMS